MKKMNFLVKFSGKYSLISSTKCFFQMVCVSVFGSILVAGCQTLDRETNKAQLHGGDEIENVIVVYLENHSFHNLMFGFPGADETLPEGYEGQRMPGGKLFETLPAVTERGQTQPDTRFPTKLLNRPFSINQFLKMSEKIPDPMHEFYLQQQQINGGKMDRFVEFSRVGALVMGYFDMRESYLWKYAREYTLADHFFQSAFGGSYINHQWLIAARTPHFENAPESMRAVLDDSGNLLKLGYLTPDGFTINTVEPFNPPFNPKFPDASKRLSPQEHATIGDRLSEKDISWAWYAGGWNDILMGKNNKNFQFHHQPFLYFKNYAPNTPGRINHLRDEEDFFAAVKAGKLPSVSFYKPVGEENAHPMYSEMRSGDEHIERVVRAIQASPYWKKSLIIVTFDEYGGFWDPINPPKVDRWGPGNRVPAVFISPHVKRGFVDHSTYETTSILAFLEKRFGLKPLGDRDAKANPLIGIFLP
jgi:phospholipase C